MAKKPAPPMVIEWWPIEKVKPYRLNPRQIGESAIQKVANSIRAFGWRQPISVDARGTIIVGHVRLLAARKLGEKKVPVDVVSHLSKAEVRAYRIADNRTGQETDWDMNLLPLELVDLGKQGIDLTLTGFDMGTLGTILEMYESDEVDGSPADQWSGMPEFVNEDKTAYKSVVVHMKDAKAVELFSKKIGREIGPKTRYIWFPGIEIEKTRDKVYD